jgi:hypothetical protein
LRAQRSNSSIPSAPSASASAAIKPSPVANPPEPMNGIAIFLSKAGISAKAGAWSSPGWPPAPKPTVGFLATRLRSILQSPGGQSSLAAGKNAGNFAESVAFYENTSRKHLRIQLFAI